MEASPKPRRVSARVASGSVMPAQKAVGSITTMEATMPATLKTT
jgi:hypothetical protein